MSTVLGATSDMSLLFVVSLEAGVAVVSAMFSPSGWMCTHLTVCVSRGRPSRRWIAAGGVAATVVTITHITGLVARSPTKSGETNDYTRT
jgi:hypothetical protein